MNMDSGVHVNLQRSMFLESSRPKTSLLRLFSQASTETGPYSLQVFESFSQWPAFACQHLCVGANLCWITNHRSLTCQWVVPKRRGCARLDPGSGAPRDFPPWHSARGGRRTPRTKGVVGLCLGQDDQDTYSPSHSRRQNEEIAHAGGLGATWWNHTKQIQILPNTN